MEFKFEHPSKIQAQTIEIIQAGKDLIAQAQAGTGKTGAFSIGILTRIDPEKKFPQAIILANTKELATQIHYVISSIAMYMNIRITLCIGGLVGKNVSSNLYESNSSHILVCTPGRIVDLLERDENKNDTRKLLDGLKTLVLDEADVLLKDDFIEQIEKIIKRIPGNSQICLYSATYNEEALYVTKKFMNNPIKILVEREKLNVEKIKHYKVNAQFEEYKFDILLELYRNINICQAVIFVNSINKAEELSEKLSQKGLKVGTIHGKLSDIERIDILRNFRKSQIRVLVTTDVLARGIDVEQVGLVINYDMPYEQETYMNRVGRSGRFHKLGVAINFVTGDRYDRTKICYHDDMKIKTVETSYRIKIIDLPPLIKVNEYLTGIDGYNFTETQ